jgi:predicted Zn finger-like uncharacterized protein
MLRIACPHCDARLRVPEGLAGMQSICPKCNNAISVPALASYEPELEPVPQKEGAATSWVTAFCIVIGTIAIALVVFGIAKMTGFPDRGIWKQP